jgi:hypothetical protein
MPLLKASEWLLAFFVLIFIAFTAAISYRTGFLGVAQLQIQNSTNESTIGIHVSGCVEHPGVIFVPLNTRICNLKNILALTPDADLSIFRHKRMLKNNDVIFVPAKRVK